MDRSWDHLLLERYCSSLHERNRLTLFSNTQNIFFIEKQRSENLIYLFLEAGQKIYVGTSFHVAWINL
jgi:hypothetical protein